MTDITSLIGGTATGGLLGLGGSLAAQVVGYFKDKQAARDALAVKAAEYAHLKEMAGLQGMEAAQQRDADLALANLKGSLEGLQASLGDQTQLSGRVSPWVADALGLVRPGLTLVLVLAALTVAVALAAGAPERMLNPFFEFASMASMAVAWWFGDRSHGKARGGA